MPDDRLSRIEATLRELELRVRVLESDRGDAIAPVAASGDVAEPALVPREAVAEFVTLTGRTLVVIGGAYLLRALTDSNIVPRTAGVALGFTYATVWLLAADRDGSRGRAVSAAFHGMVACLIAFPLIWEATVRFSIFGTRASATALTAASLMAVAVALHGRAQAIAWFAMSLALPVAVALIVVTDADLPLVVFLVTFGVAMLWVGYTWDWVWLRWPAALIADGAVCALAFRSPGPSGATPIVAVQLLLLNGYVGSVAVRTIFRARDVIMFEVVQTAAALAVGFGGAVFVAEHSGSSAEWLAVVTLVFGAGCYGVAFVFVRNRPRNFSFYGTLAFVLVLSSASLLFASAPLTLGLDAAAVACAFAGARIGGFMLDAHAAMYLLAAATASQLLPAGLEALVWPAGSHWTPFSGPALVTLATLAACWRWPMARRPDRTFYGWLPRVAVALILVIAAAGWIVSVVTPALADADVESPAGVVATIRTGAIAAVALALGLVASGARFRESSWLLYPVLVLGGVKLLLEDFPRSKPATLFLALAMYGGALIAAPRLSRRHSQFRGVPS